MPYLYRHIRHDTNEVFYIGIGGLSKFDNYKRAYSTGSRNKHWKSIVRLTSYNVEIMLEHESEIFIKNKEQEFIKLYGRKDLKTGTLVNQTDGGDGSWSVVVSEETKRKKHEKNSGINCYWFGKKLSKEHKINLSKSKIGKKLPRFSETHRIKIGKAMLKRKYNCYDLEGNFIKSYLGTGELKSNNLSPGNVHCCCTGKKKTYKGFIWRFDSSFNK